MDDLPTGPIPDARVAGTWIYSVAELRGSGGGGGYSCSIQNVSISLAQEENRVTGATSGGTLQCLGPGASELNEALGPMQILDGLVIENLIRFAFEDETWIHVGTVAGNQIIVGNMEWTRNDLDIVPVRLQGSFQALKQ